MMILAPPALVDEGLVVVSIPKTAKKDRLLYSFLVHGGDRVLWLQHRGLESGIINKIRHALLEDRSGREEKDWAAGMGIEPADCINSLHVYGPERPFMHLTDCC